MSNVYHVPQMIEINPVWIDETKAVKYSTIPTTRIPAKPRRTSKYTRRQGAKELERNLKRLSTR